MFAYQQNKCAECLPCTIERFKALTKAPETARKVDDVRRLKACGQTAEANKRKGALPGCLYQTKEVLVSVGEAKYNKGRQGRWRLQSQCVLNGLVMCDFDHVDEPRKTWTLIDNGLLATDNSLRERILLVFITLVVRG
jgi:hypothetical protein